MHSPGGLVHIKKRISNHKFIVIIGTQIFKHLKSQNAELSSIFVLQKIKLKIRMLQDFVEELICKKIQRIYNLNHQYVNSNYDVNALKYHAPNR